MISAIFSKDESIGASGYDFMHNLCVKIMLSVMWYFRKLQVLHSQP